MTHSAPPWPGRWKSFVGPMPARVRKDRPPVQVRLHDGALAIPIWRRGWHWTIVAAEDAWALSYNWFEHQNEYVVCNLGKRLRYLHRLVAWCRREQRSTLDGFWMSRNTVVDHIDRDPRNNHRANLRAVDASTNGFNRAPRRKGASAPGVTWDESRQRWLAKLKHRGKDVFVGRFISEQQAERVMERTRRALERTAAHTALVKAGSADDGPTPF